MKYFLCSFCLWVVVSCNTNTDKTITADETRDVVPPPTTIGFSIVNTYPHDTSSYTQGLELHHNFLYEGTGRYGLSKLYKVNLANGRQLQKIEIENTFFGEGITILNNKIYQLTWKENKVFVYDLATFKKLGEFEWPYDGWGLTNNGTNLIISTGSSTLYYVNPADFKIVKQLMVSLPNNEPVQHLNELEWANGFVYANIYLKDFVVKINPTSGKVEGTIDFEDLLKKTGKSTDANHEDVLNGIAYDSTKQTFYITGKLWPALYEVKLSK